MKPLAGMDVFDHDSSGFLELQRDDEADVFAGDDAAWKYFLQTLKGRLPCVEQKRAIRMAILLLENWREPMGEVMRGRYPHPDGTNIDMRELTCTLSPREAA